MEQEPVFDADSKVKEQAGPEKKAVWDIANRVCDRHGLKEKGERPEPRG